IAAIVPSASENTAGAGLRVDGTGLTALPGLIDAHVHTFANALGTSPKFGVTTVLDMFTDPANLSGMQAARDSHAASDQAALFSAGMLATAEGGHGTQFPITVETLAGPAQAAAWVESRLAEGSDYIKLVYMPGWEARPTIDLATASALITAAHGQGVLAVAHIATLEGARELLDAGVDGFVHIFADELVDEAFLAQARAQSVFVIPTLSVIAAAAGETPGVDLAATAPEAFLARLDPLAQTNLRSTYGRTSAVFDLPTALENVRRLHDAGVAILAGSDAPNPGTAHGATLHGELALLVRAGLTPAQALAAATSVPARVFGLASRGIVAEGARADLVLVRGDPLADIRATRVIEDVLRNGHRLSSPIDLSPTSNTGSPLPALLAHFDDSLDAPEAMAWSSTSDELMGGTSTATISHVPGTSGFLSIQATVTEDFSYPWGGAFLGYSTPEMTGDLSDVRAIRFRIRGTPGDYRLMMFALGSFGAPPTATVAVTRRWQEVEVDTAQFAGFVPTLFTGMAFVTPSNAGEYAFALDEVRLVR
ncbi:MAG: CIA30 family protein, partial [Pseudomonadota bacterium]